MSEDLSRELADPHCLTADQARALLTDAPWHRFAAVGDSIAAGTGDPCPGYAHVPWAERVRAALHTAHPDLAYLNTGVGGATAHQIRIGQLDRVLAFQPDLVVLAAGGNDLWAQQPDFDGLAADLDAMHAALRAAGADVVAFCLANVFDGYPELAGFADRVRALNTITREVVARHGGVLVDLWDHPVRNSPTLLSADRVHFTAHGHAVTAAEVIRALADHRARLAA